MHSPPKLPLRFSLRTALIATTALALLAAFLGRFVDRPYVLTVAAILICAYIVPLVLALREGINRAPSGTTATVILGLGVMLVARAWRDLPSATAAYRSQLRITELVGILCVMMAVVAFARKRLIER
jgi:hypothetical protein